VSGYRLSHLDELEAEAIHIIREVVAEFERPVMLYSVGKDSACMVRLAQKAFAPGRFPFPLLHIDTTFKFQEMYDFRDRFVEEIGATLLIHTQSDGIQIGMNPLEFGTAKCCGVWKTRGLLDGLAIGEYDAAFGGARREGIGDPDIPLRVHMHTMRPTDHSRPEATDQTAIETEEKDRVDLREFGTEVFPASLPDPDLHSIWRRIDCARRTPGPARRELAPDAVDRGVARTLSVQAELGPFRSHGLDGGGSLLAGRAGTLWRTAGAQCEEGEDDYGDLKLRSVRHVASWGC